MSQEVFVSASGSIDRSERCEHCGTPMYYRVDIAGKPFEMFCGMPGCVLWLLGHPLPGVRAGSGVEGTK